MLALKLLLTPVLVGLISLAGRRWGTRVSGWLVGLPLTSAPIAFFVAHEQGAVFAAGVARGTLMGLIAQAAFCVIYAWLSLRFTWPVGWLLGWSVFLAVALSLAHSAAPLPLAFALVAGVLLLALLLWPEHDEHTLAPRSPAWEIPGRMGMATALVLALTSAAPRLGPHLSGAFATLPVFATTFAIFAHQGQGAPAARQILHGVIVSSFACAVFFLVVAGSIEQWPLAAVFGAATLAALLTQGCALRVLRRQPRRRLFPNHTSPAARRAAAGDGTAQAGP
jgi:hypothetical protein